MRRMIGRGRQGEKRGKVGETVKKWIGVGGESQS